MAEQSTHVIHMLKDMAAKEVELAAEALAQAIKVANEAQSKHDMLRDYRQSYADNLVKSMEIGISAESYLNFQNFLHKLDQAMSGQMEMVEYTKRQVQVQRELWQESQRKKLSYDVLSQRSDKKAQQAELKKDQKMMDEYAMRISRPARK